METYKELFFQISTIPHCLKTVKTRESLLIWNEISPLQLR